MCPGFWVHIRLAAVAFYKVTGEQVTDRWEKVPATGRKRMNTIRFDELDLNPQILRGNTDSESGNPGGFIRCGRYRTGSDRNRQDSSFWNSDFTESRPVFTENAGFDFISHQRARHSGGRRNP